MTEATMLAGWTGFYTETRFLDNTMASWAVLLVLLLGGMVVGRILTFVLDRQSKRLQQNEHLHMVGLVFACLSRPAYVGVLAGALYLASFVINLQFGETDIRPLWLNICRAMATMAVGWFIYRLVDVVEHYLTKLTARTQTSLDDQLVPLIRKSLRVFTVIILTLFIAKNIFDFNIGSMLAGLGIGGLAIALAAKDALANLFGSVTIFADRPFHMGDRIKIHGHDGIVEEVGFRSTRIRTLLGHQVIIPNSLIVNEPLENIGRRPHLKRTFDVTVTYDTSPEKLQLAVNIIREMLAARSEHFAADRPPRVFFADFNAHSLDICVYYWFTPPDWWDYLEFNHDFNMELLRRFNEEGIDFAFPTQTLHIKPDASFGPSDAS